LPAGPAGGAAAGGDDAPFESRKYVSAAEAARTGTRRIQRRIRKRDGERWANYEKPLRELSAFVCDDTLFVQ
jgi:hypothetical protein